MTEPDPRKLFPSDLDLESLSLDDLVGMFFSTPKVSREEVLRILVPVLDAGIEYLSIESAVKYPELNKLDQQHNIRAELVDTVTVCLKNLQYTGAEIDAAVQYVMDSDAIPFHQDKEHMASLFPLTVTEEVKALFPQQAVITFGDEDPNCGCPSHMKD